MSFLYKADEAYASILKYVDEVRHLMRSRKKLTLKACGVAGCLHMEISSSSHRNDADERQSLAQMKSIGMQ